MSIDSPFDSPSQFGPSGLVQIPRFSQNLPAGLAWMHWHQDWYRVGFWPSVPKTRNPRKPLYLQGLKLEAGVRIERLTLGFLRVLKPCIQQLGDYSNTIRPYSITRSEEHTSELQSL